MREEGTAGQEGARGQYGDAAHAPCSAASPCDIYVVMLGFEQEVADTTVYADYDQPWGYTMAQFNQLFNGGYDGVPAYTGTIAHKSASRDSTENLEVFGSVRAYFHQVHGEDILRFRILNRCANDPCRATDEPVWIQLNAPGHSDSKWWYATHPPADFWPAAEAAACANLTLPADFPLANPCGTTPAASAATLLANKVVYLYAGVTFTPEGTPLALHPRVNKVTRSTTVDSLIGARYVMGEREGFGWTNHTVDRFAGIGTHVHEIGHLFGFVHPQGSWTGPNPHHPDPDTSRISMEFKGANASSWGMMQNSLHGPGLSSGGYTVSHPSCPQPFNPFYRMDLGWNTAHTISSTTPNRRIDPGPEDFYVVHSTANRQDYILDFRTASNFGQYTGFHPFTASPGLLIWRRSPTNPGTPRNNTSNPMVIPADGRSIHDARDRGQRPNVPEHRDRLSDPFGAAPQTHGPTVTQATDVSHLTHSTTNNRINRPSRLAFRNIRNEGTHALVDIYVNYWSGSLTGTQNWSDTVYVGGDVTVASGATLTLAADTEVRFLANTDDTGGGTDTGKSELIVSGTLNASAGGITFSSTNADPDTAEWYGVRVLSGGSANLTGATLRDGVVCAQNAGTLTLSNTTFTDCGLIAGSDSVSYAENGADSVATYAVTDPSTGTGSSTGTWSVSGTDASGFTFSGDTLFFASAPDFERPSDADRTNVYGMRVQATDSPRFTASKPVQVTVTDVDEAGRVSLSTMSPQAGRELKAVLHDPDGVENLSWRWFSIAAKPGASAMGTTTGEGKTTPGSHMLGRRLLARATYDDGHGTGKQAVSDTTAAVTAGPPSKPELTAQVSAKRVAVSWTESDSNGAWVTSYSVRDSSAGSWSSWVAVPGKGTARDTTRTGLTNGREYTFEVRARNRVGEGDSSRVSATPQQVVVSGADSVLRQALVQLEQQHLFQVLPVRRAEPRLFHQLPNFILDQPRRIQEEPFLVFPAHEVPSQGLGTSPGCYLLTGKS